MKATKKKEEQPSNKTTTAEEKFPYVPEFEDEFNDDPEIEIKKLAEKVRIDDISADSSYSNEYSENSDAPSANSLLDSAPADPNEPEEDDFLELSAETRSQA